MAAEGNFAKAGDRLGIGRSAVSRSVQKLEEQLGTRLFVRTTRSTSLTTQGERFYAQCHPGVERIVQALEEMRELRDGPPAGQLRKFAPAAMLCFNDADLVLQAVLDGQGIAQMAGYQVSEHLRAGTLVACLPQYAPDDRGHCLCFLGRQHLPVRMRVFIDYMTEQIRALDLQSIDRVLS